MIGIIDDPNGHPVRQDDTGTPAEYKEGPYLLSDAVSLEAPIPVILVDGESYVDTAENLRDVWPMNISNPTPAPIPGPLDFGSNEMGRITYFTPFDVAAPHIVFGMCFRYTGNPVFQVAHNAEVLTEGRVVLNGGVGVMIFVGSNITIESGNITLTCEGGTFGPFYGRVNEMPFAPDMDSLEFIEAEFSTQMHTFSHAGPSAGRVYGATCASWFTSLPRVDPLVIRSACRDFSAADGVGFDWQMGPDGSNWIWDRDEMVAAHSGSIADASPPNPLGATHNSGFRFRAELNADVFPTTQSVQYRSPDGLSGSNAGLSRFGNVVTSSFSNTEPRASFQLRMNGDVEVSNIKVYKGTDPDVVGIGGVIASEDGVSSWTYSSSNAFPTAGISLKVLPV